jgi:guanylate kinase
MGEQNVADRLVNPAQVFVLSGPSGVGKNTIAAELCARGRAVRAVTATTRLPKEGETDGRDYHFVSADEFLRWIDEGRLIEHTSYVGHYYGTPLASVNTAAATGLPVLLTIDVDGGLQVKERWPQVTLVFISPPSEEELRRRLQRRGRDDAATIEKRLRRAREEAAYVDRYDSRVVNDSLDEAVEDVACIIARTHGERDNDN